MCGFLGLTGLRAQSTELCLSGGSSQVLLQVFIVPFPHVFKIEGEEVLSEDNLQELVWGHNSRCQAGRQAPLAISLVPKVFIMYQVQEGRSWVTIVHR